MTINTQKLREHAGNLKPPHLDVAIMLLGAADAYDAQTAEIARLREALRCLIRGYVNTLEFGRDRIKDLGGDCDPVGVMEANDPHLRAARAALAQEGS